MRFGASPAKPAPEAFQPGCRFGRSQFEAFLQYGLVFTQEEYQHACLIRYPLLDPPGWVELCAARLLAEIPTPLGVRIVSRRPPEDGLNFCQGHAFLDPLKAV